MSRRIKTLSDYMQLDEDSRVELVEGEFFMTPSPNFRHQMTLMKLGTHLHLFATQNGVGCVIPAPFDAILSDHDVVQPDLVYVATENLGRIHERLHGPPDLAVEIQSASNAERDRIVKRDLYRKYGVREYWLVDPNADTIEVLSLDSGEWRLHGIFRKGEHLDSPLLPGLRVPLDEVFD